MNELTSPTVLRTTSSYAAEIRPLLSAEAFVPRRLRLLWLPVHYAVVAVCMLAIVKGWLAWPLQLVLSLVIGASFAGLTFVGHEALHGSIVRNRPLRRLVGWFGFMPFSVSPRLWEAWHNRVHHGHTNEPGIDPDAYPTLDEYNASLAVRRMTDWMAPGRSRFGGIFSLLFGFTIQSTHILVVASSQKFLSRRQHWLAVFESGIALSVWVVLALKIGAGAFLLAFGLPLIVGNSIIMSLILTNHSLSPHTDVNDPLINSLSVSGPPFLEWLTLGFGYHVEHHLFPAMSGWHGPELRAIVRKLWPDRYQGMPYFRALLLLHRSPRVYRNDTTLCDPRSSITWPTLTPSFGAVRGSAYAARVLLRTDGEAIGAAISEESGPSA